MKKFTLLLTGTIDPSVFNKDKSLRKINVYLTDYNERLRQYENAIKLYIQKSVFTDIVFIENSGAEFDAKYFEELATSFGKRFEFICRELNEEQIRLMQLRGKSYGEADLIDYAIQNSRLISEDTVVYKATGRAFLKNSSSVIKSGDNAFVAKNKIGWVNTEFFKVSKELYFSCLSCGIDLMDDYKQQNIERVWYNLMKKSMGGGYPQNIVF